MIADPIHPITATTLQTESRLHPQAGHNFEIAPLKINLNLLKWAQKTRRVAKPRMTQTMIGVIRRRQRSLEFKSKRAIATKILPSMPIASESESAS